MFSKLSTKLSPSSASDFMKCLGSGGSKSSNRVNIVPVPVALLFLIHISALSRTTSHQTGSDVWRVSVQWLPSRAVYFTVFRVSGGAHPLFIYPPPSWLPEEGEVSAQAGSMKPSSSLSGTLDSHTASSLKVGRILISS